MHPWLLILLWYCWEGSKLEKRRIILSSNVCAGKANKIALKCSESLSVEHVCSVLFCPSMGALCPYFRVSGKECIMVQHHIGMPLLCKAWCSWNKWTCKFHAHLKGRMILRCVKKAISYRCPYVIAIVIPHQIYTAVVMTICANQENNIV